jgi:hypothetical protein
MGIDSGGTGDYAYRPEDDPDLDYDEPRSNEAMQEIGGYAGLAETWDSPDYLNDSITADAPDSESPEAGDIDDDVFTPEPNDQPSPSGRAVDAFTHDVLQQAVWSTAEYLANTVSPGAGVIIAGAYVAIKAASALHTLNCGDGFVVMFPIDITGTGLAFSVGVRQASDRFGIRLRVDLMNYAYAEGAPDRPAAPLPRGEWPGEWTMQFGWAGIREHGAVLARDARVVRLDGWSLEFTSPPGFDNSVVWELLHAEDCCTVTLPDSTAIDLPYSNGAQEAL